MEIGGRLRELREQKEMSQGDIERKSGLLRCYISRVENGHTIPSVDTLEKLARALEVPMYRLFHNGDVKPKPLSAMKLSPLTEEWGSSGKDGKLLNQMRKALEKISTRDRDTLMHLVRKMARA